MPEKKKAFEDGSCITWQDRETLRYEEGSHFVLIWVDYEPGLFRKGRIVKLTSLQRWQGTEITISPDQRAGIIAKVVEYFGRVPVRVE